MLTRKMNVRITIFKKEGGQNEDGEVLDDVRTNVMSCWAEVSKKWFRRHQSHSPSRTGSADSVFFNSFSPFGSLPSVV